MQGGKERCIAAGMSDYITKPIEFEPLERVMETRLVNKDNFTQNSELGEKNLRWTLLILNT